MKQTFVGHKFQLSNSKRTGISLLLSSLSSENMIEKYSISFDDECKIERIIDEHISFGDKVSDKDFFNRLIRDIKSTDEKTREIASISLCDFLEFEINSFEISVLKTGIEQVIEQISVENNGNVEHKLVEGLFEYIWWGKINKKEELKLLERLTKIDSYHIWSYIEDELEDDYKNLNSRILKEYYIKNKPKWDEKNNSLNKKKSVLNKLKFIFKKKSVGKIFSSSIYASFQNLQSKDNPKKKQC